MDFSKIKFANLFYYVILSQGMISVSGYIAIRLYHPDFYGYVGYVTSQWIQIMALLSKTYFMHGHWKESSKPQFIITGLSFFVNSGILIYFSFFQANLPFFLGFFIANYFTMKIFVSTAYILLKYEPKNV